MKRTALFVLFLLMALAGLTLAQDAPEGEPAVPPPPFTLIQQFGQLPPQGIQYDANFDRFVMVDLQGQLLLVDAATYETQHILYNAGTYNAYTFSHDGRYLGLAIDRRVELWDTRTGQLSAMLEPAGALVANAPLVFSPDDGLLLLNTIVPAPPELRRSENDTSNLPWLWDLNDALNLGNSSLPNRVEAYPFFDYRYGMILGPNRTIIGGYPGRLNVQDARDRELPLVAEIPANRQERDPLYIWRSATDNMMYVDSRSGSFVQIDTDTGTTHTLSLEQQVGYGSFEMAADFTRSRVTRVLGEPNSQVSNSLLRLLLNDDYLSYQNYAPTTVMLLDILVPMTVTPDQFGLLIYTYNETTERGVLEILRPSDIQQIALHPDNTRLMVRRASGLYPIEIYDLDSGLLEKTLFPSNTDISASQILSYNHDGSVIVSGFQRFDALTGAVINQVIDYDIGDFSEIYFTPDNQRLVTFSGDEWRLWDLTTGDLIRVEQRRMVGNMIERRPDSSHYLSLVNDDSGQSLEIYDVGANERQLIPLPTSHGYIERVIPDALWRNFILIYSGQNLGVMDADGVELTYILGQDLLISAYDYGWLDDRTVYITGDTRPPSPRRYGLDYHPSGLPQCLVERFPDTWENWVDLWDSLSYRLDGLTFEFLNRRLCEKPPEAATALIPALTPTPRSFYYSQPTLVPPGLPGVPSCLTRRFPDEQLNYADLWREMSEGLSDAEKLELETLLCEGLISSLSQMQPTPTVNPNLLFAVTPTPASSGPEIVDSGTQALGVMLLDIHTLNRSFGSYIPSTPEPPRPRDMNLVISRYVREFSVQPYNPVLSPDGTMLATLDDYGFVRVYRLGESYDQLMAAATATYIAEFPAETAGPRSIGLPPTATPPFSPLGLPSPTLTVTITPTAPAPPDASAVIPETVEDVCPARQLYDIAVSAAPDYAAAGRLLMYPIAEPYNTWVLEPENGHYYPDDTLPTCGIDENCEFSFDGQWILRYGDDVRVSRPDGSDLTVLYPTQESSVWPSNFYWRGLHTLEWAYQGYLPEKYPYQVTLYRSFDPETAETSEPFEYQFDVRINELSTSAVSQQPNNGSTWLLSTPYRGPGGGGGNRYYIYDAETETTEYFVRVDSGTLDFRWHPMGAALYYRRPGVDGWFAYDPETRQHAFLTKSLQDGNWSPNGRYSLNWFTLSGEEYRQRLSNGELPLKLKLWDSETNTTRRYCLPETGDATFEPQLYWSPDSRYVAFTISLPPDKDKFVTPVGTETPVPTFTPVPLEVQYDSQFPRLLVLDTVTGYVTIISKAATNVLVWTEDAR